MKISTFIFLGFVLILSMFSVTTYINYQLAGQVNENSEWLSRSTSMVRQSNRFQRNILNMVSGLRGYLLSGEHYFLQAFDSAAMENQGILTELPSLMPKESNQQAELKVIVGLHDNWVQTFARPLIEMKTASLTSDSLHRAFQKSYKEKLARGEESRINNALQNRLRNFINYEYSMRDLRRDALSDTIEKTGKVSVLLTTTSIVTGLFIAAFLAHRISTRIVHMVKMANTLAQGNYDVRMPETGKDELSRLAKSMNHMAQVLEENIALLKRKNKELDQFAHIVSHDLKAPVRGIDNVVTWIEEDHWNELSPKVKEYLHVIKGRVTRSENLIKGILSYARIGRDELPREVVDTKQLIEEIAETTPNTSGVKIEIDSAMPVLISERIFLTQIFSNLISNAIKYHDKPDGFVKIFHREEETNYVFFVQDNGPGIAKNYHNKIFVIFQTLNENNSFENTGVGLAIVKKIIEDKNQTISVLSEQGKGSTFSFTWPKF
jgi:signal transduction histidine kinase